MVWVAAAAAVGGALLSSSSASKDRAAAQESIGRSQASIEEAAAQARTDALGLFPQAQEARAGGFDAARGIFEQVVPQQVGAFQQGNLQAQTTTGAAPQQIQNALLGLPVDFGFLQPQQQFQPDFSFLQGPQQESVMRQGQRVAVPNIVSTTPNTGQLDLSQFIANFGQGFK